jgi:hypothetical protein
MAAQRLPAVIQHATALPRSGDLQTCRMGYSGLARRFLPSQKTRFAANCLRRMMSIDVEFTTIVVTI